ncbi:response regulator receiver and ANTAR domain protein [Thermoclostridium stercorarium subsp. stercorarium DSM 8532]|jgi:AmiR/NasT family two-component response regulator|uniref:Stage 0 sporulation protein A homolog n=2 Tax=Thermoclostridium stercorarium TaxID=1510 RepID=L7VPN5_THES1|nr:ANTAR domain-containing protein [Thermoclostridium stercorarium]AGC68757.1 response regulator receiver and ANTAR domain protein [Thermoclostridium stercorarium subsp. stercorarium DSM 8532]AGI39765.1 response regulator [Thermoclostridium stercorarium subsp. stercorarium DSM 8532]ANX01617.1 response regulator receiver protein [Thermoclostridium stercorarium subsp. leptospartum DSM 9219]UZQ84728.1 ANTAR domain-containing protein [Thermoclostridium stercorarium]
MDSALIISGSDKIAMSLAEMLAQASVTEVTTVSNGGEARRMLIERDFDLYIINTPLPDEFGESLALSIATKEISVVILIVKAELMDEVSDRVEDYGVITLGRPLSRALFWNALKLASATHKKLKAIHNENKKLIQKIEDLRVIDRAKCILISRFSMTEPEAHRFIEKQAMDMRITRRKVAEKILRVYEN